MRSVLVAILACVAARTATAGPWPQKQGVIQASPSVFFYSTQRQFSSTGGQTYLHFNGTFHMSVLTLYAEWGATDALTVIGDVPAAHTEFEARDSTHAYTRALTSLVYFGGGVRYALWRQGPSILAASAMLHVPSGFHNGLYDDATHPFLSDGFLEAVVGLEAGTSAQWGWLEAALLFHARGEEASNQLELRSVVGFASRQNVHLKLTLAAVASLVRLPREPVYAEETNAAEQYLWLDGQVTFKLAENFALAGSLGLRIIGAHALALSGGGVSVLF